MKKKDNTGWIKIYRKIQDTQGYFGEPFCKNMAWIDLLLLANHADNFFFVRGVKVDVKRGQCGYSEDKLAERWQWSRGKVRRFLMVLQKGQQIVQLKNHVTTLISIVNYEQYQDVGTTNGTTNKTTDGTTDGRKQRIIKNDIEYIAELKKFYRKEIDSNKSHEKVGEYKSMLNYLFGENETGVAFINVLRMENQITFKSFLSMESVSIETNESSKDILNEMENYKKLRENNTSIPATAMNWMRRNYKNKNKAA